MQFPEGLENTPFKTQQFHSEIEWPLVITLKTEKSAWFSTWIGCNINLTTLWKNELKKYKMRFVMAQV